MAFRVSGKNMDIGEALRTRVTDRVGDALSRFFNGSANGHVTVTRDGAGYATECVLHLSSGMTLQAVGTAMDAYQSADAAAMQLEKRLKRYKQRLKDHHAGRETNGAAPQAAAYILAAPAEDEEDTPDGEYHPVIIAESTTTLKQLSVGEAVIDLDLTGAQVLVFRHAGHGRVNVVYRRPDGNIGWVDPPPSGSNG